VGSSKAKMARFLMEYSKMGRKMEKVSLAFQTGQTIRGNLSLINMMARENSRQKYKNIKDNSGMGRCMGRECLDTSWIGNIKVTLRMG